MVTYTDNSQMPMGEHKGKKLIDVPAGSLMWYWNQPWLDKKSPLAVYIASILDVLQVQAVRERELNK